MFYALNFKSLTKDSLSISIHGFVSPNTCLLVLAVMGGSGDARLRPIFINLILKN